jgi:hypothetical protein
MGPALPDLQLIAGVPLQQATWLFTGFAIGYLGGCLLAGFSKYFFKNIHFYETKGNFGHTMVFHLSVRLSVCLFAVR